MALEGILGRLWDEYLSKNVKSGTSPEELKAIGRVFNWGAYLMFREMVEINKDVWQVLNKEFEAIAKELEIK